MVYKPNYMVYFINKNNEISDERRLGKFTFKERRY